MDEESKCFLDLLTDYINQRNSYCDLNFSEKNLIDLARIHGVGGIVYKQSKIPQLKNDYFSCIYRYQNRIILINEIKNLLDKNNIPFFIVKGPIIANYYPDPFLRTMGDVDIIVKTSDFNNAVLLLSESGYHIEPSELERKFEIHFSKSGFNFELHHSLLYKERVNEDEYVEYFNRCWEWVQSGKIDVSFHFLYVIMHMRKHFLNGGIGVRFFLDLALISQSDDIDWKFIADELKKLNLYNFTSICFCLCKAWFGSENRFESIDLPIKFIHESQKLVLSNGIFGNSKSSEVIKATNLIRKYNQRYDDRNIFFRKLVYVGRTLFPTYTEMVKMEKYSFVCGKKILLPVAWLYRIIYTMITRPKEAFKELKNPYKYRKEISIREELYREWKV